MHMIPEIEAVILAGGLGIRMRGLTKDLHKSMLPVEGRPILIHILDNLKSAFGSARIVIATGYKEETIRERIGKRYGNLSIEYVNDPRHLETAGRLLLAEGLLNGPFLVIGTDIIVNPAYYEKTAQAFHFTSNILGVDTGATDVVPAPTHALIHTDDNKITYIQMRPTISGSSNGLLRDMGLYYFHNKFWSLLRDDPSKNINMGDVINEGIRRGGDFIAEKYLDRWYHFAYPKDLDASIVFNS